MLNETDIKDKNLIYDFNLCSKLLVCFCNYWFFLRYGLFYLCLCLATFSDKLLKYKQTIK